MKILVFSSIFLFFLSAFSAEKIFFSDLQQMVGESAKKLVNSLSEINAKNPDLNMKIDVKLVFSNCIWEAAADGRNHPVAAGALKASECSSKIDGLCVGRANCSMLGKGFLSTKSHSEETSMVQPIDNVIVEAVCQGKVQGNDLKCPSAGECVSATDAKFYKMAVTEGKPGEEGTKTIDFRGAQ